MRFLSCVKRSEMAGAIGVTICMISLVLSSVLGECWGAAGLLAKGLTNSRIARCSWAKPIHLVWLTGELSALTVE